MSNNSATDDLVDDWLVQPYNGLRDVGEQIGDLIAPDVPRPVDPLAQPNTFEPDTQSDIAQRLRIQRSRARTLDSFRIPSNRSDTGLSTPGRSG